MCFPHCLEIPNDRQILIAELQRAFLRAFLLGWVHLLDTRFKLFQRSSHIVVPASAADIVVACVVDDIVFPAADRSHLQYNCRKIGTAQIGITQAGIEQVGTAQVSTAQVGTAQVGTAQVSTAQVGIAQVGTAQIGTAQVGSVQGSIAQVGPAQGSIA